MCIKYDPPQYIGNSYNDPAETHPVSYTQKQPYMTPKNLSWISPIRMTIKTDLHIFFFEQAIPSPLKAIISYIVYIPITLISIYFYNVHVVNIVTTIYIYISNNIQ